MPPVTPDAVDLLQLGGGNAFLFALDPYEGGAPIDRLTEKTVTGDADSATNLLATAVAQVYEADGETSVGNACTLTWNAALLDGAGAWAGRLEADIAVTENVLYLVCVTLTLTTSGVPFPFWRRVKFVRIGEA